MSCSAAPCESKTGWEHFPHDADVGVRGRGLTAAEAFEQAAQALTAVITHGELSCGAGDMQLGADAVSRHSWTRCWLQFSIATPRHSMD
jgi:hypothetical protein